MLLTQHQTTNGVRWAVDGQFLLAELDLSALLEMRRDVMFNVLASAATGEPTIGAQVAPIDPGHEVWAAGVTYLRSRDARRAESAVADVYDKVYEAARPELFFKSLGWRVAGNGMPIRIRSASARTVSGMCRSRSWCSS
jgi:2-dehydro-3-deoxy-D-arabinonate dehydratase